MSVNKVMIVGRLGQDPELKQTAGGPLVSMSVATSERWTAKDGNKQERTEWHRVTVFGSTADACAKYLRKGSMVYVEGRLQTDTVEKDGHKVYYTKIIASAVQFLDSKAKTEQQQPAKGGPLDELDELPF